jgi:hypothetical protein
MMVDAGGVFLLGDGLVTVFVVEGVAEDQGLGPV